MNRKGISPLIATVLLIAFTVAVGGIFNLWITGYGKSQTTQVTQTSNDQISCSSVLSISTYNPTGFSNAAIGFRVSYDYGTLNLSNPVVSITCGSNTTNTNTSLGSWIAPGQLIAGNVSNTACSSLSSITLARVVANCTGPSTNVNYPRVGDCVAGQVCMQ